MIKIAHRLTNEIQLQPRLGDISLSTLISHLEMLNESGFCLKEIQFNHLTVRQVDGSSVTALTVRADRIVTQELLPSKAAAYQQEVQR